MRSLHLLVLLFGIFCVGIYGCNKLKSGAPTNAVAKINGTIITKAQFDQEVDRTLARFKGPTGTIPPQLEVRIKDATLKRMIDDQLIRAKAKELNVTVTPDELNQKLAEHKKRFGSEEEYREFLNRSKSTEEQVKQSLEMQILRDQVMEKMAPAVDASDADIAAYYNEHKEQFKEPEQVRARHILAKVETPPTQPNQKPDAAANKKFVDEAKKKAKTKIEAALKKIKSGAKFEDVAKDFSDDVTKANGGDLGYFGHGRMVPAFDEAAFKLKPGQMSGIVETPFGFHLIKVEDHKDARDRSLDEVKDSIKASLIARKRGEARRDALKKIKDEAKVEEFVKFDIPAPAVPRPPMNAPGATPAPATPPAAAQPPATPPPSTPPIDKK